MSQVCSNEIYSATMELVDTHCHLTFPPLADDLGGVLGRAREKGVTKIIVPAYDLSSWDAVEQLADHVSIFPALGLHPWMAEEQIDYDVLERRLHASGAVAVGEIGLDFELDAVNRDRQLRVLEQQLQIAAALNLPVLLHCRGAFEELLQVLDRFSPPLRGVLHAFSRGTELAARFIDAGLHLAFGGAVTRPRALRARRSAARVPIDRFLLETDAPSIGLDGMPPQEVEPRHVADIAAALAEIRDVPEKEIARSTTANAKELFRFD